MYGGNLNEEDLLDWIVAIYTFFESEDVPNDEMVKKVKTKLKRHALLWWNYEQDERRMRGKGKITSWDRMVAKLKGKFLPRDYEVQLFKKLQSLKQKDLNVKKYTNEFYKFSIRVGRDEGEVEKVSRYLGGLRFNIQDDLVVSNPKIVEEYFQLAIKVEEKIKRRLDKSNRRRGKNTRGRGYFSTNK